MTTDNYLFHFLPNCHLHLNTKVCPVPENALSVYRIIINMMPTTPRYGNKNSCSNHVRSPSSKELFSSVGGVILSKERSQTPPLRLQILGNASDFVHLPLR